MNVELDVAQPRLDELISEWHAIANAPEGSDLIAPDGKFAHLGRINKAGQKALHEYKKIVGDQANQDLLERIPVTFTWQDAQS